VVGAVAVVRVRRRRALLSTLRAPLLGAALGALSIFVYGFIAQRFLGDAYPLLLLAAATGFAVAVRSLARAPVAWRRVGVSAFVVLAVASLWVTFGEALWYQRVYASPPDEAATRQFVQWQLDAPSLSGGSIGPVRQGTHLPTVGHAGDLFIVGDCAGLYVSDGSMNDELQRTNWKPVERTAQVGKWDLDVTFPRAEPGTSEPLLVSRSDDHDNVLSVEYLGNDQVRFRYEGEGPSNVSQPVDITPGRRYHVQLSADPQIDLLAVRIGDRTVFDTRYDPEALPRVGVNDLDHSTSPRFTGTIRRRPESTALCREVRRRAGLG